MNCPTCGHEAPTAANFCPKCGASLQLELACPRCGAPNSPANNFCLKCGAPLASSAEAPRAAPSSTGAPIAAPTNFCGGRYTVVRFLGEGGKKRVYLAHDTKLDRDVAFALIKTDGLDAEGEARIRREAQAMGKLGDHPHIVPVYDIGEEGAELYLVSQLLAGGDVEGLIESAPDHRVPIAQALRIADQVCQALGYAHSHGIVHRDLKPGNVWLTADGVAKLGDFGLAISLDRSRLTQAGTMVGTVSYMPPEQAMGGDITPRSDLYSLGAMLYELVCGRPPFVGDDAVAIIGQHLNTLPIAPSWHRPDCPPGLAALIMRLLEKDSAKRPAAASEVQELLASVSPSATPPSGETTSVDPSGARDSLAADNPLYRRAFVGREGELRQLHNAFDAALSGQGGLVMVVGEPGIGKTSLTEQLATYVTLRGGRALVGHCYEEGSLSFPYLPFVEAMRSYVLARDPEALKQDLGPGAAEVARIVSEVRELVPVLPRPPGDPEEERWRLLQAVTGFLRNASSVQPLLLVLEDIHDADRGTLDLLMYLTRNLEGARLLIAGTYRDVDVDRGHPLSGALAELRRNSSFLRVSLRGLTAEEVQRMMLSVAQREIPWAFAELLHRQTEGNPLFVQEMLRYLVEEGLVAGQEGALRRVGDESLAGRIPEGLRDVIGKRLSRLEDGTNQVLAVAAVIGRDFRLDALQSVTGLLNEELDAALQQAEERAIVEPRPTVGTLAFRFTHAFFRQSLYEEIFASGRLRLHQQVARALEQVYGRRVDDHAAELAEHFARSTDPTDLEKALHYSELAARRSMQVFAYGEAARHLDGALKLQEVLDPDDKGKRCDLLLALGEALGPAGEVQRVFDDVAEQALTLAEALGDGTRAAPICQLAIEALQRWRGAAVQRAPAFLRWVERLDRHATPGTRARVEVDKLLAAIHLRAGRWAEARRLEAGALAAARELGDADALFLVFDETLAGEGAPRTWPELVTLARELADQPREGISRHKLGVFLLNGPEILLAAGERERVEGLWYEQEQLAANSQDAELRLTAGVNEFYRALLDGDLEGAVALTERWVSLGEDLGSPARAAGGARLYSFWPLLWLGRFEALATLAASRTEGGASPNSLAQEGLVLAHHGATDDARAQLHQLMERLEISDEAPAKTIALLLETAVLVRDREAAALLASTLDHLTAIIRPVSAVARHLGAAARLHGDPAAARAHDERALRWATKIRCRPEVALTRLELAELLLDDYPEEKAEAMRHVDFAVEEFRGMKMQPSLERALRHKGLLRA